MSFDIDESTVVLFGLLGKALDAQPGLTVSISKNEVYELTRMVRSGRMPFKIATDNSDLLYPKWTVTSLKNQEKKPTRLFDLE